jgi:hypothetical protein
MFVVSQYLLNVSGICKTQQNLTYSIALGLIIYSSIYLYLLFYNGEYISIFNKFIIYIVIIDLLLSAFYYFGLQDKQDKEEYINLNKNSGKSSKLNEVNDSDDSDNSYDSENSNDSDNSNDLDDLEELDNLDDSNESEIEYNDNKEKLEVESQKYIDNLIAQAKLSDQQRMSEFINNKEITNSIDIEHKNNSSNENSNLQNNKEDTINQEVQDSVNQEVQDSVNQEIEDVIQDVIEDVLVKKKPKRVYKKKPQLESIPE